MAATITLSVGFLKTPPGRTFVEALAVELKPYFKSKTTQFNNSPDPSADTGTSMSSRAPSPHHGQPNAEPIQEVPTRRFETTLVPKFIEVGPNESAPSFSDTRAAIAEKTRHMSEREMLIDIMYTIKTMQNDIHQLYTKADKLEAGVGEIKTSMTTMREQIGNLRRDYAELKKKVNKLMSQSTSIGKNVVASRNMFARIFRIRPSADADQE